MTNPQKMLELVDKSARVMGAIHLRIEVTRDWRLSEDEHQELANARLALIQCAAALRTASERPAASLADAAIDALNDAAQFVDAVKPDAVSEGWWTDWDGQMREKITKALVRAYAAKGDGSISIEQLDVLQFGRALHSRPERLAAGDAIRNALCRVRPLLEAAAAGSRVQVAAGTILSEVNAALSTPTAPAGDVREALEKINGLLDIVWDTNDRFIEVDGLVKMKNIVRAALPVQETKR